ncbi:unnamed protein product [Rotaria magnacalcarata]|uniref:PX domain-containing protein n=1 Tax=Rotaria magnacalcarata TaxID=392030 RepID=A0A8S2NGW0_9BILA|nr:unnamed protein product [Rotaria magnacalcarata]
MGHHGLHLLHSRAWEKHHELPIHGVRSQRQMHRLISKLAGLQQPADRLQQLVYEIKTSPQAFSGDQLIQVAPYFPGTELVLALHLLDHHLFGLRCDQAVRLLEMIPKPEQEAEHYLDHLQPEGHTNTHDALKQALNDEEADTIYLLSDGEPSTDMRTILWDLKVWLQQRRNPCVIHAITFLMGNTQNDPKPREFMAEIAKISGGVFRCIDPFTPLHQEFGADSYSDNPNFNDDEFIRFFEGRLMDVPPYLLQSVGLYNRQQYPPATMGASSVPGQAPPLYPVPQYPPTPANATYQPPQQNMPSVMGPYQGQNFSNPPSTNFNYQPAQQNMPSGMGPYQGQNFSNPPATYFNYQPPQQNMPFVMNPNQGQSFSNPPPPNFKLQIKSRSRLQDEIDVPSVHHGNGHDRFDIRLNIRQLAPGHDGQWSVTHTFDELKHLHHQLQKRCSVPSFPQNHHSLIHMGKQDREKRRQDVEAYLKQLYVYVSPYEHPEFDLFLLMELHLNQIVQQAEVEWKTHQNQQQQQELKAPYTDEPPPYEGYIK